MPRKCSICTHQQRTEIETMLAQGTSYRNVVAVYPDTTETSLHRHVKNHISKTIQKAADSRDIERGTDLLTQCEKLQQKALALLKEAEEQKDIRAATACIKEARSSLELYAKLSGQFPSEKIVHMIIPVLDSVVSVLKSELQYHPELLRRVKQRLLTEAGGHMENTTITIEGGQ